MQGLTLLDVRSCSSVSKGALKRSPSSFTALLVLETADGLAGLEKCWLRKKESTVVSSGETRLISRYSFPGIQGFRSVKKSSSPLLTTGLLTFAKTRFILVRLLGRKDDFKNNQSPLPLRILAYLVGHCLLYNRVSGRAGSPLVTSCSPDRFFLLSLFLCVDYVSVSYGRNFNGISEWEHLHIYTEERSHLVS